jgi:ABC-type Co2+ transport system permease subunit
MSFVILFIVLMVPIMYAGIRKIGKVQPSENTSSKWGLILCLSMAVVLGAFMYTNNVHLSKYSLFGLFLSLLAGASTFYRAFIKKSNDDWTLKS